MSEHTPDPWRVEAGTTLIWGACNAQDLSTYGMGYPIVECRISPERSSWAKGPSEAEGEANAHLIAAVPDLLAALHLVRMSVGWQYMVMETRAIIDAAIAKAEGLAP